MKLTIQKCRKGVLHVAQTLLLNVGGKSTWGDDLCLHGPIPPPLPQEKKGSIPQGL